jgi:hypothetical protein
MIADGGETISELAVLRNQPELFETVASNPTAWRTLEAATTPRWPASRQPGPSPKSWREPRTPIRGST